MSYPLEPPRPVDVSGLQALAFYAPGTGPTPWDIRCASACLANFFPLPSRMTIEHKGAAGSFTNSEAAYQCFKWWQDEATRALFEACGAPGFAGGEAAYQLKKRCECDQRLAAVRKRNFDGLGKFDAMLLVLRHKWRLPHLREYLIATAGVFLVEHSPVVGRDPYWTDDCDGGGQNRLGAALMLVRAELLAEDGISTHGWPDGVPRPAWVAGAAVAAVAEDTDGWQRVVKSVAAQLAARTADDGSVLPE
jgi:predicted NAD-dependent protein-ADP-ribosyltransferase YbiA (DUF1768 family)